MVSKVGMTLTIYGSGVGQLDQWYLTRCVCRSTQLFFCGDFKLLIYFTTPYLMLYRVKQSLARLNYILR